VSSVEKAPIGVFSNSSKYDTMDRVNKGII